MVLHPHLSSRMRTKGDLAVRTYLREWRVFRDLTQEELAAAAGTTPPAISQLENGHQGFTDKSLAAYARALRCTPADLLAFDPTNKEAFWPLLQAAERLGGRDRRRAHAIIAAAIDPRLDGSE